MEQQKIRDVIVPLFKEKESFRQIGLDDDYFDLGVSSLTIVGLQIKVEEKLGMTLATSSVMSFNTINQWVDAYVAKYKELSGEAAP